MGVPRRGIEDDLGLPTDDSSVVNDEMILNAVKRRLMRQLGDQDMYGGGHGKADAASIINNIYGGDIPSGGGVYDRLAAGGGGGAGGMGGGADDPFDYLVDIERRDLPELNPLTGKPAGWTKKVTRKRIPIDKKKV